MKNLNQKKSQTLLGSRIRKFRTEQNISQAQLAYEVEISREQITHTENGHVNTTFYTLYKIASALNIEFDELFTFLK